MRCLDLVEDLTLMRRHVLYFAKQGRKMLFFIATVLPLNANVAKGEKRKADATAKELISKRVRGAKAIIQIPLIQSPSPDVVI